MNEITALLSDSDGTLVNTVDLIRHGQFETAVEYYKKLEIPARDIPDYETYEQALHHVVGGRTQDTMWETAQLLFRSRPDYLRAMNPEDLYSGLQAVQDRLAPKYVTAYPGLDKMLYGLGDKAIKFAIFTSGDQRMIVRNIGIPLTRLGLTELYLDDSYTNQQKMDIFIAAMQETYHIPLMTVVTTDDTTRHKPHPEGLQIAMKRLGVQPEHVAVMGDHKYDMEAAIAAGVPHRFAVTHGFHGGKELMEYEATRVINELPEVPALLR